MLGAAGQVSIVGPEVSTSGDYASRDDANTVFLTSVTFNQSGVVFAFIVYCLNVSPVRLQVWRPTNMTTAYRLVCQHRLVPDLDQLQRRAVVSASLHLIYLSPVSIQTQRTQRTQRNRLRCVRWVNEKRKKRKRLIGCFDDCLLRSTIPIGWRLRALRLNGNRVLRNVFACLILLRLLRFFSYARPCVRCVRLNGNRALRF